MNDENRSRYLTRSVERALTILHLFIVGEAEISLSEISQRVALHQSTVFRLLATLSAAGFTEQNPHTGRYRQIRRHLKHLSHHLIGDSSHGDGRHNRSFRMMGVHRMLLHAWRLAFVHPVTGAAIECESMPDQEFLKALQRLSIDYPLAATPAAA